MDFKVLSVGTDVKSEDSGFVYLVEDNWNDWWRFRTMYQVYYMDVSSHEEPTYIGSVKIGEIGMEKDQDKVNIEKEFNALSDKFFSLGQDKYYYENLNRLGDAFRDEFLKNMNDVAYNLELLESVKKLDVSEVSIFRDVNKRRVREEFHRLAKGISELTEYKFRYDYTFSTNSDSKEITFISTPDANPPTNLQAIIGRNGVGKTHLLNQMIGTLLNQKRDDVNKGNITNLLSRRERIFDNIIYLSFSAFDEALFYQPEKLQRNDIGYTYIGLKTHDKSKKNKGDRNKKLLTKSTDELRYEFIDSMWKCRGIPSKKARLEQAIEMLSADSIFARSGITDLLKPFEYELELYQLARLNKVKISEDDQKEAKSMFTKMAFPIVKKFSSGHSIVLLTITKLIEELEEKTLVLLDEPESHLHPPLLSTLTRILSNLMVNRNGIGIIATHSPVVLQEIPSKCVWVADRFGSDFELSRPEIETFGENINTLTKKVFSFEITESGFHKLLKDVSKKVNSYEEAIDYFNGEIGIEGKAILKSLMAHREKDIDA